MNVWHTLLRTIITAALVALNYGILGLAGVLSLFFPRASYLRWLALGIAGMRKIEKGATGKAKHLGTELINLSKNYEGDRNHGNAVHKGNLILGRVALREGDIEAAKQYLVNAAQIEGSPQLASFGPNMILAKELLEAGEQEAVLDYFRLCEKFWTLDSGRTKRWTATVRDGGIPNFGPNLIY